MTRSGKPQVPLEKAEQIHQKRLSRRRGRRHSTAVTERNPKQIYRDHQRRWPAAKTPKASYLRRKRRGG